eukprot:11896972-Prorocentrum_lima.AAC.1
MDAVRPEQPTISHATWLHLVETRRSRRNRAGLPSLSRARVGATLGQALVRKHAHDVAARIKLNNTTTNIGNAAQ